MPNGKVNLPDEFEQSCQKHASYPLNLILSGTKNYHSTLESYKARLDENEAQLCVRKETLVHIPIRELFSNGANSNLKIQTPKELSKWLGGNKAISVASPLDTIPITTKTIPPPKCRFIYIYGQNSRDHLQITRNMLTQILTYFQVMPAYLDFMFTFGSQSDARDLRFSGFREQSMLKDLSHIHQRSSNRLKVVRSERQFQLCYNLKGVSVKNRTIGVRRGFEPDCEWSIRQAAIHHQFGVLSGATLWIVTKGRLDIKERFERLTCPDGRPEDKSFVDVQACFGSSLAAHLMFCHWSTEDWRWYISWFETVIESASSMALYGPREPTHTQYTPLHIQELQRWKDQVSEAVMVLEANIQVIASLQIFYIALKTNRDVPLAIRRDCKGDIEVFATNLDEIIDELNQHTSRAKLLVGIIEDRKELILQHLQGQTAERTDQLNRNLEKEAIVMRIMTIVALLYLPATFVSTFFSTNIVQYQNLNPEGGEAFSMMAMKKWLEVTLPLTTITLLGAWLMYRNAERTRHKRKTPPPELAPGIAREDAGIAWWRFGTLKRKKSVLPWCNEMRELG